MTARFWQVVLLIAGLVAALAAPGLSRMTGVPLMVAWLIGMMLWHALLIALTYLVAVVIDHAHGRKDALGALLRAPRVIGTEFWALGWLQWRMAMQPFVRPRERPNDVAGNRPVLLLHGLLCSRVVWFYLRRRLLAAGFGPVVAVDLDATVASIDTQAVSASQALESLHQSCSRAPVIIIGHSMGGLVARAALRKMSKEQIATRIAALITIATPHHGSAMARVLPGTAPAQLVPGSSFLAELNAERCGAVTIPAVSIYSLDDNLVAPRASPCLAGAQQVALRGLGHFATLLSTAVWRELRQALQPRAAMPS